MDYTHGVRFMTLESRAYKESVAALEYAGRVFIEETRSQICLAEVGSLSGHITTVTDSLAEFLSAKYDEHFWKDVLGQVGLVDSTKRDAEFFINICAAWITSDYTELFFSTCESLASRRRVSRKFGKVKDSMKSVKSTASAELAKYQLDLPFPDFNAFNDACSEALKLVYNDIV